MLFWELSDRSKRNRDFKVPARFYFIVKGHRGSRGDDGQTVAQGGRRTQQRSGKKRRLEVRLNGRVSGLDQRGLPVKERTQL